MGPETGLAFFYFDINDKAKQSSRSLLSSLVLGLTAKSKKYLPLQMLYEKHDKLYNPTEGELLDLLMELLRGFKQAYIAGHAAIFIYKCPVIPRKRLYINAHPTGVRNSYVIMTARLRLDRIWHQCALSIFG